MERTRFSASIQASLPVQPTRTLMVTILPYKNVLPRIDKTVFVAETAAIVGDVEIAANSGIWFGVVVRGDVNDIKIGCSTNIQDNSVIHVATDGQGCYIGDHVTVGHMAVLHACSIESNAFVGLKACVMDDAVIEPGAMVAAGALVTPGKRVPSGQLWAGSPARYMRDLRPEEAEANALNNARYVELAARYLKFQSVRESSSVG